MKRWFSRLVVTLVVSEMILVLVSWLLSATMTGEVRSLLSSEGIRWFLGSFTAMLASPLLVWILLLTVTGGCLWQSGLLRFQLSDYRQRVAFVATSALMLLYIGCVVALAAAPHAILLSATGHLFPSAFSRALLPLAAFGVLLASLSFGLMSGRFANITDAVWSITSGPAKAAPLLVAYILIIQFWESLRFVFV